LVVEEEGEETLLPSKVTARLAEAPDWSPIHTWETAEENLGELDLELELELVGKVAALLVVGGDFVRGVHGLAVRVHVGLLHVDVWPGHALVKIDFLNFSRHVILRHIMDARTHARTPLARCRHSCVGTVRTAGAAAAVYVRVMDAFPTAIAATATALLPYLN
jgi:hypothetical protein